MRDLTDRCWEEMTLPLLLLADFLLCVAESAEV